MLLRSTEVPSAISLPVPGWEKAGVDVDGLSRLTYSVHGSYP